jgi:hypothetical protein
MTRRTLVLAGLLALALATPAPAGYITGVAATTNMGTGGGNIAHIVDGSGLSSLSLTATHALGDNTNDWLSATLRLTGQVNFDLHGTFTLVGMSVWNFSGVALNNAGVQGVSVSTSTDGVTFTPLVGSPNTFAQGVLNAPQPAQQFTFGQVMADFVRFDILSNYGNPNVTGLLEVGFDGTPVTAGVPAPPTLLLGLVGAACVARLRRRGR